MNTKFFGRTIIVQALAILFFWVLLGLYVYFIQGQWNPKITITSFITIPAAVIIIGQLAVNAHISRASYIKDYAIRFRTDRELTESFHYLVYRFGNTQYTIFKNKDKSSEEEKMLEEYQKNLDDQLKFFDPENAKGLPQERRLDNLLGFFDTVGYDLKRGLLNINDVAGVFGFHLDHFNQRQVVNDYLENIKKEWPNMKSFHEDYLAPTPFRYLRYLMKTYVIYQADLNKKHANMEENDL